MTDSQPQPLVFTDNPMNPLEEALYEGLADHRNMGAFERLMLEADLYAVPEPGSPGGVAGDDGAKVLRPGEALVLRGVTLNDGRDTVTLFTDPRRAVEMFGPDARILAMNGRNLLHILKEAVVLLNPAGGKGLLLNPDQIQAVLEHETIRALERPTGPVELGEVAAADEPAFLTDNLRRVLTAPGEAAWLARANWPEAGVVGWFVDVRSDRPADEIRALVLRAVHGLNFGAETLDVATTAPGGEDGVGIKIV